MLFQQTHRFQPKLIPDEARLANNKSADIRKSKPNNSNTGTTNKERQEHHMYINQ